MPFVTEEIYHQLKQQPDDLCVKQFVPATPADREQLAAGELAKQTITAIRDARTKNGIKPKESIRLSIQSADSTGYTKIESILAKQAVTESITYVTDAVPEAITVMLGKDKLFIGSDRELDTAAQKESLLKDLDYLKGFLLSVEKKLSNERFVQNAKPEVVDIEKKKKKDAEEKIKAIEESLAGI
jgi:valyl-tRNA synthetase